MAEIVLFHHIQGPTPGLEAFADRLRSPGHIVHTPDLFGGRTFDSIDAGFAFAQEVGFDSLLARAEEAVARLPAELVYGGFSFGVMAAQKLAQTRPGARGALLFEACVPVSEFGERWPVGVHVQIHGMDADEFFAGEGDVDAARALVAEARASAIAELFLYPGDSHLFTDGSLDSSDEDATDLVVRRVHEFLARIG